MQLESSSENRGRSIIQTLTFLVLERHCLSQIRPSPLYRAFSFIEYNPGMLSPVLGLLGYIPLCPFILESHRLTRPPRFEFP